MDAESSIELIERARRGDRRALDALLTRYLPPLRRWASGRLPAWARDVMDTEDMIQETLIKTFGNLDAFRPEREGALQAYLRQALRNRVIDELRRAHRRPRPDELPEDERTRDASPLEQTIGREALHRYEKALERLGETDREAIVARVEMGCTYEEIARELGRPSPDAARMAVSRALVRLAREMADG